MKPAAADSLLARILIGADMEAQCRGGDRGCTKGARSSWDAGQNDHRRGVGGRAVSRGYADLRYKRPNGAYTRRGAKRLLPGLPDDGWPWPRCGKNSSRIQSWHNERCDRQRPGNHQSGALGRPARRAKALLISRPRRISRCKRWLMLRSQRIPSSLMEPSPRTLSTRGRQTR